MSNTGPDFSANAKALIIKATKQVLTDRPVNDNTDEQRRAVVRNGPTVIMAQLTDLETADPRHYSWTEQFWDNATDTWTAGPVGGTFTNTPAIDAAKYPGDPLDRTDEYVALLRGVYVDGDTAFQPCFYVITPPQLSVFPVDVEMDGGSAGDQSTVCSFTYIVKSKDGTVLGSGKSPLRDRLTACTMNAGTLGTAYWGLTGSIVLWDVNETNNNQACT